MAKTEFELTMKNATSLTPDLSLAAIEQSSATSAQKRFMELTVNFGKAFWHDFGNGPICILDVSHFLNHGVDVELQKAIVDDLAIKLASVDATKALTAASGGNILTFELCHRLGIPRMISASKSPNIVQIQNGFYSTEGHSYTGGHGIGLTVTQSLLKPADRVLIVDDFLDTGRMTVNLADIASQAGAQIVGFAYAVNKTYAGGEKTISELAANLNIPGRDIASFISITGMEDGIVHFDGFDKSFSLRNQYTEK